MNKMIVDEVRGCYLWRKEQKISPIAEMKNL